MPLNFTLTFIPVTKIGLISDTHGFLDQKVLEDFKDCDEVWHAGDFGISVFEDLEKFKPLKAVFGNIDDAAVRNKCPEQLIFQCEEVRVLMRHIGGSPPAYNPETKRQLKIHMPQLFICGHSHILKVIYDDKMNCLHMNPGAAGMQGWHQMRTIIRFVINGKNIEDCEVIELGKKY